MIIEKVNIKSFGMITDMSLDFSSDINVIVGHNEAGKSTLAAFIKYMLYGFGNTAVGDGPDERAKRINWDSGTAGGSMTILVGGKRYLINRTTERVENGTQRATYREDCSITDLETGSPAFGKVPAGEVFFGVDKELFENTAFIGQIGDSSINEGSVKESIENILFSGSERINNQRAAQKVAVKMETLLHKGNTGGAIYELMRRSEQLEERFKAADEDNKQILAKEARLHEIKTQRKEAAELSEKLRDLDLCYRNVVIIQSFDELHELEKRSDEKAEEYNAYVAANTRAEYVPTSNYLTEIAVARRGVDDTYRTLVDAQDRYSREKSASGITRETEAAIELSDSHGGEETVVSKANDLNKRRIRNISLSVLLVLAALAVAVYEIVATGAFANLLPRILFGIVGLTALGGAGYFTYLFLGDRKELIALESGFSTETLKDLLDKLDIIAEEREKRDKMIRDTEDARLMLEKAKADYQHAKDELLSVILRWGEEPPTSNLNEFLDGLEERVRVFLEGERAILEVKNELDISVRELRRSLADKSEIDIRAQVSPLKRKVLSEIDHDSILQGIEECREKISVFDALAGEVEDELAVLKLRATDPAELYAKMQENDARIEELRTQHKSCYAALCAIQCASDNLREEISPRLGEYSTALMEIMTDKKYSDLDVTDGLKVSFTTASGDKKSVDFLSGGTRDLTYIALRMALIDMLYTEKPPTLFDESFAHQDNARARSMMRAIKELADEGQQSFIFTCREREAALAKELSTKAEVYKFSAKDEALD